MSRPLYAFARELREADRDRYRRAVRTLSAKLDRLPSDDAERPRLVALILAARTEAARLDGLASRGR